MKVKILLTTFASIWMTNSVFAVTVTMDPTNVTSSIMIEDFNGSTNPSQGGYHDLDFVSITNGLAEWSYAAGGSATEAYTAFDSITTFDPTVYKHIRIRMYSDRDDEYSAVQIFPYPIQGDGRITMGYPDGNVLAEASWDLSSVSPTTPFDGTGLRVDPFNYINETGTDVWKIDYIIADAGGVTRGAEFDCQADLTEDRFYTKNCESVSIDTNGILSGVSTTTDPNIYLYAYGSPYLSGIAIHADSYKYVEIRVKSQAGSEIKWFWKTDLTGYMGVVLATAAENDGEWHTYLCDMTDETGWSGGYLTYNRLDPTDANGASFSVDYCRFMSAIPPGPKPTVGYIAWAEQWGGTNVIGSQTNDYDHDGMNNLYEYGLNGNPTNEFDQGTLPVYSVVNEGGSNVFRCVCPQLSNSGNGLIYSLALTTNLVGASWITNTGYVITGTNSTGNTLDFVTNAISMANNRKFIRLVINKSE